MRLDYNQDRGKYRIGCVGTAYSLSLIHILFSSMGADITKSNVVKTLSDMNAIREKED